MNLYFKVWFMGMAAMSQQEKMGAPINEGMDYFELEREIAAYRQQLQNKHMDTFEDEE